MANEFVVMYVENLMKSPQIETLTATDMKILLELLGKAKMIRTDNFLGGNTVTVGTQYKKKYCIDNKISTETFEKTIRHLKKANIIRKIDGYRGLYQFNPFYFCMGTKKDVDIFKKKVEEKNWFRSPMPKSSKLIHTMDELDVSEDEAKELEELALEEEKIEEKTRHSINRWFE